MSSSNLTSHLLSQTSSPDYIAATTHPFLKQAGDGTLPIATLAHWLYQDRIYAAHAYPRFIGLLIPKIPFSSNELSTFGSEVTPVEKRNRKILESLTFSLSNILKEVQFFEETASGIDASAAGADEVKKEREATRNYCAEMARVAGLGTLEEGLVFLWAMEKMYLDSWSFAAKQNNTSADSDNPSPLRQFIKNWTSSEFIQFVDDLKNLVDIMDIQKGSESWKRAEAVWNRVVELEIAFWPNVLMN